MNEHWYYLHTDGSLIHKRHEPDWSDFVRRIWMIDPTRREQSWNIVTEALTLGADHERVRELCKTWGIVKEELPQWLTHSRPTEERRKGLRILIEEIWEEEYDDVLTVGPMSELIRNYAEKKDK